jgi:Ca2+/H+ antiporter
MPTISILLYAFYLVLTAVTHTSLFISLYCRCQAVDRQEVL